MEELLREEIAGASAMLGIWSVRGCTRWSKIMTRVLATGQGLLLLQLILGACLVFSLTEIVEKLFFTCMTVFWWKVHVLWSCLLVPPAWPLDMKISQFYSRFMQLLRWKRIWCKSPAGFDVRLHSRNNPCRCLHVPRIVDSMRGASGDTGVVCGASSILSRLSVLAGGNGAEDRMNVDNCLLKRYSSLIMKYLYILPLTSEFSLRLALTHHTPRCVSYRGVCQ